MRRSTALGLLALSALAVLALGIWLGAADGVYSSFGESRGVEITEGVLPGGLALDARIFAPRGPRDGLVPGVVIVHGTSPSGSRLLLYEILARELARGGAQVLLYDQRGYGRSPDPPREHGRYALEFVADAARAVGYLGSLPGVDAADLRVIGHSFGGSVVIGLSHLSGVECQVRRIIVASPGRGWPHEGEERQRFRAQRLSWDMALDPPMSPSEAAQLYAPMEVETLVSTRPAVDVVLLHTGEEEQRHPLRPVIAGADPPLALLVIPDTDHYFGTRSMLNDMRLPFDFFPAGTMATLVDAILAPPPPRPAHCR